MLPSSASQAWTVIRHYRVHGFAMPAAMGSVKFEPCLVRIEPLSQRFSLLRKTAMASPTRLIQISLHHASTPHPRTAIPRTSQGHAREPCRPAPSNALMCSSLSRCCSLHAWAPTRNCGVCCSNPMTFVIWPRHADHCAAPLPQQRCDG